MIGRTPRWFLALGIVTATLGCDNVSWGGVKVRLQGPPVDSTASPEDSLGRGAGGTGASELEIPQMGSLLYAGFRRGDSAWVTPVAELGNGHLQALPQGEAGEAVGEEILQSRLRPGTKLTLFQEGVRIGTLTLTGTGSTSNEYCPPRPVAGGILELVPPAMEVQRFLALADSLGRDWPFETYAPLESQYAQRAASLDMAAAAVNDVGARWPPSLLNIRADLRVFPVRGSDEPAVTATFLFDDQLAVGPAPSDAYSLMIIGERRGGAFARTYTWYRPVEAEGKGAPMLFARLDWDRDGTEEILLEVYGEQARWWASLDRRANAWQLDFQDSCGSREGESPAG